MLAKLKLGAQLLSLFLVLETAYWIGAAEQYNEWVASTQQRLEQRIALDSPGLRLSNPLFAQVADVEAIKAYITAVNQQLAAQGAPVRLIAIQDITLDDAGDIETTRSELSTVNNTIAVAVAYESMSLWQGLSAWPLLLTLGFAFVGTRRHRYKTTSAEQNKMVVPETKPHLIIDLRDKTLSLSGTDHKVKLSNKPFCFYTALIDYCEHYPDAKLNQSKDLPTEFLESANKYFYRLMDLGHTRRRRPDFNTNLDKTLSEIRAALDELFAEHNDLKVVYYPPKAQGEGSRSKLHNFGLPDISTCELEFIGR